MEKQLSSKDFSKTTTDFANAFSNSTFIPPAKAGGNSINPFNPLICGKKLCASATLRD